MRGGVAGAGSARTSMRPIVTRTIGRSFCGSVWRSEGRRSRAVGREGAEFRAALMLGSACRTTWGVSWTCGSTSLRRARFLGPAGAAPSRRRAGPKGRAKFPALSRPPLDRFRLRRPGRLFSRPKARSTAFWPSAFGRCRFDRFRSARSPGSWRDASTSDAISTTGAGANLGATIGSTRGAVPRARSTSLARKCVMRPASPGRFAGAEPEG